ncbi:hypothetical protein SXCC_00559 [Gluconacetobacter sp. SXCC-1]|nr:hypothetical protein SXCC_00559 [Gluconacetobacter sp. SXCC-1]
MNCASHITYHLGDIIRDRFFIVFPAANLGFIIASAKSAVEFIFDVGLT